MVDKAAFTVIAYVQLYMRFGCCTLPVLTLASREAMVFQMHIAQREADLPDPYQVRW